MTNPPESRRPRDMARVDTTDEWELRYWARELGLSTRELEQAVREVGDSVEALRRRRPEQRPNRDEGRP
ncbi:MAG TPA: DUF3606 domain-containing protein [Xanthomonadaceae bacterium]|nr:DUF3606 domain-containing protein [Xanthomonadaceae bacterium]